MADGQSASDLAKQLLAQIGTGKKDEATTTAPAALPEAAAAAELLKQIAPSGAPAATAPTTAVPSGEKVVMQVEGGGRVVQLPFDGTEAVDVVTGQQVPRFSFVSPGYSTNNQRIVQGIMQGLPVREAIAGAGGAPEAPLREQFSREEFATAGRAAGGLVGGEGVAEIPETMPLVRPGGAEVSFPAPVRAVGEYLGDAAITAGAAGSGAWNYAGGAIADIMASTGLMSPETAQRFARDFAALPEAFAGSPGQLTTAPRLAAPRGVRGAPAAPPAAAEAPLMLPAPPRALPSPSAVRPTVAPPASMPPAAPPVAPVAAAAPSAAPGAAPAAGPAAAPSGGPSARPSAAAAVDEDARIGELIRKGASFGIGGRRAREELARLAVANPEAKAAADRLGIELPVDVLSDVRQIREAIGMTRSIGGSEAKRTWSDNLTDITERADKAITDLAGATDLSTVSSSVLDNLSETQSQLRGEARKIYDDVEAIVPPGTVFQPNNIVIALNKIIGDLGGVEGMTDAERKLFKLVTNPDQPITYKRLMREKDQIRRAKDGDIRENPYGSIDQKSLNSMYDALVADQLANAERIGGVDLRKNLELANSLWAQQSELGDKIVLGFGADKNGSISAKLRTAITSGKKGDISGLNRILEIVPKDLRKEAVLSAIREVSTSTQGGERGFGFSQFTDFYSSMRRNPVVYKEIVKIIGPEAETVLRDLYEVSRRVTDARANIMSTGKANQPLYGAMVAEGLVGKVFSSTAGRRAVRAAGSGGGALVGGIPGAMLGDAITDAITSGSPDRLKDAGKLFASDAFKDLVAKAATNTVTEKAKSRLIADPAFRKWAKSADIGDPRIWINGALLGLTADQGEKPERRSMAPQ
jgi:hypothetical protein